MKMKAVLGLVGALAVAAAVAAPQFEPVPAGANRALKAVKGKPIRTGMVFVNGHYIKPPYVLMRSGTALFVNFTTQITDQLVPWKTFLATQGGAAAAPKPAAPASRPAPAPKPKPVMQVNTVQDIDDLFADTPAPAPKPAPRPARTMVVVPDEPEVDDNAPFTPNDHSRRLLKRINDQRSYLDLRLREGDVIFFGSRYVTVNVTPRLARDLLAILPEAMRDVNDGTELLGRLRGKGINYLSREICEDLIENRTDYPQLIERRKEMERSDEVNRLLRGVR